jgi:hypothetical protein
LLQPVLAPAGDGHRGPLIGESQRKRAADPAAPTGDPNDLVLKTPRHGVRVAAPRRACQALRAGAIGGARTVKAPPIVQAVWASGLAQRKVA